MFSFLKIVTSVTKDKNQGHKVISYEVNDTILQYPVINFIICIKLQLLC